MFGFHLVLMALMAIGSSSPGSNKLCDLTEDQAGLEALLEDPLDIACLDRLMQFADHCLRSGMDRYWFYGSFLPKIEELILESNVLVDCAAGRVVKTENQLLASLFLAILKARLQLSQQNGCSWENILWQHLGDKHLPEITRLTIMDSLEVLSMERLRKRYRHLLDDDGATYYMKDRAAISLILENRDQEEIPITELVPFFDSPNIYIRKNAFWISSDRIYEGELDSWLPLIWSGSLELFFLPDLDCRRDCADMLMSFLIHDPNPKRSSEMGLLLEKQSFFQIDDVMSPLYILEYLARRLPPEYFDPLLQNATVCYLEDPATSDLVLEVLELLQPILEIRNRK